MMNKINPIRIGILCLFFTVSIGNYADAQSIDIIKKLDSYYNKGKYEKAVAFCEKQNEKDKKGCYYKLGRLFFTSNKDEEASKYFLLSNQPDKGITSIVDRYIKSKNYQKADQYLSKMKETGDYYRKLGYYTLKQKNYNDCIKYFNKSSKPDEGYQKVGDVYYSKKDYIKAMEYYQKASSPDYGYFKMAKHHFWEKDTAKAIEFINKMSNPDGGYKYIGNKCLDNYISYKKNKNYQKPFEYYSKVKDNKDLLIEKANYLFKKKHYEAADYYYDKANLSDKTSILLGDKFFKAKKPEIAYKYYEKVFDREKAYCRMAEMATKQPNYTLAMDYYIKLYKDDAQKLEEKMNLLLKTSSKYKSKETEIKIYEQTIKANPNINNEIIIKVAQYYHNKQDYYKAVQNYEILKDEDNVKANYLLLAEDCRKKRDYLCAFVAYREVKDLKKANSVLKALFRNYVIDIAEKKYSSLNRFENTMISVEKKYGVKVVKDCLLNTSTELSKESVLVQKQLKPNSSALAKNTMKNIAQTKKTAADMAKKIYTNYRKFQTTKTLKGIVK